MTLCDLVTVFGETKGVIKSRLHCTTEKETHYSDRGSALHITLKTLTNMTSVVDYEYWVYKFK